MQKDFALLTDIYQIYMSNGYLKSKICDKTVVFDLFFREIPDRGGFAIMAGVEELVNAINSFRFSKEEISFLKGHFNFNKEFLTYLENFKFTGDVFSFMEGTPIFPNESIITVKAKLIEAQLLETVLLRSISFQTLVATKANRMVRASGGRNVAEFGTKHAHTDLSALLGSRAAYIGGCDATSNLLANKYYDIPLIGAMTHNYILMFKNELEAFKAYARENSDNCVFIVDTYNPLISGIPNAIRAFNEEILPLGKRPKGILIGSGDITYISKKARQMLDEAGFFDCPIIAANALDEYIIRDMLIQGAKIDMFGVSEHLITVSSQPIFSLVYKLVAVYNGDKVTNILKMSQNANKITTPGFKSVHRFFDRDTGKALADLITFNDEIIDDTKPFEIFDPEYLWKTKVLENFVVRKLQKQIFKDGKQIIKLPNVSEIRKYAKGQIDTLWEEMLRFEHPHKYYVDLSKRVWTEREKLLSMQTNYKGDIKR